MAGYTMPLAASLQSLRYVHEKVLELYLNSQAIVSDIWREGDAPGIGSDAYGRLVGLAEALEDDERESHRGIDLFFWFQRAQDDRPQETDGVTAPSVHDEALNRGVCGLHAVRAFIDGDGEPIRRYIDSDTEPLGDPCVIQDSLARELSRAVNLFERWSGPPEGHQPAAVIPTEFLTRVVSKVDAARLHSGQRKANGSDYIATMVSIGRLTAPIGSGQSWQFDIRQFPDSVRDKLR